MNKYDMNGNLDLRKQTYTLLLISTVARVLQVILLGALLYMIYPIIPIFN